MAYPQIMALRAASFVTEGLCKLFCEYGRHGIIRNGYNTPTDQLVKPREVHLHRIEREFCSGGETATNEGRSWRRRSENGVIL